jgi:hypothetical protein
MHIGGARHCATGCHNQRDPLQEQREDDCVVKKTTMTTVFGRRSPIHCLNALLKLPCKLKVSGDPASEGDP